MLFDFSKKCSDKCLSTYKKSKIGLLPHAVHKSSLKMYQRCERKAKTIRLLEEN